MKTIKKFLSTLLAALIAFTPPVAYPAFDPVNDDTDIFLANPNITANRPNVLIALDNTANWNQPFVNEKNALVQVVNNLSDQFNVGLMMMPETGNPNDNTDGGYVRFHIRQMTQTHKTALASIVNNFHILNDKGNNATHGAMLYEAYLYYGGKPALSGDGKAKADFDGTTDPIISALPATANGKPNRALPGPRSGAPLPTDSGVYRSPIEDGCQKNFIILISNGPADNNVTELAGVERKLAALTGVNPPSQISVTPNGRQGNWSDEMARFMANSDVFPTDASIPNSSNVQNVYTYVVEVNPGTTGLGPDWTAVMKSTAINGNGKYFGVTDDASGAAIVDALNAIFAEIQAVNSVFASSSLPVSVSVRGSFLNQLYVGVFRPDAVKSPRWLGNLKLYAFDQDPNTGAVFLVDANGSPAVNPATNFIAPGAQSFWSQGSTFWGFRDASQNGLGGANDIPDGEIVEKGGGGQQVRVAYPDAEGSSPTRNLYTCTTGDVNGTAQNCTTNSALADTPFIDGNAGITTALLQLGTRLVSPLTGFLTKTVASLTDRRSVSITNANPAGSVSVTSLSNGASQVTISDLRTSTPKVVSSLSGATTGTVTVTLTSLSKVAGQWTLVTGAGLSGVTAGTVFTINCTAGDTTAINSLTATQRTVTTVNSTTSYVINGPSSGNPSCTAGTVSGPGLVETSTITVTLASHGYTAGLPVTIAGAGTYTNVNGTFNIASTPTADTFTYTLPSGSAGQATGTITASSISTTVTATSTAHGFTPGSTMALTIYGANPTGYNGSVSAFIVDANTFTYSVAAPGLSPNTASPVYAIRCPTTCTTVTATAPGHTFLVGNSVTISGATIPEYNGTFTITGVSGNDFTYSPGSTVLPATGGTIIASSAGGTLPTVTATLTGHGFSVGESIQIESTSSPADTNHPGNYTVATVPDANTFTYSTGVAVPAPTGAFTARSTTTPLAFVTVTGHGYSTGNQIVIAGATPAGYNGTKTITVVDANTFTYPLSTALGANTGSAVTSSIKTSTARATSVAHGFSNGDTVTIAGANIAAFNGTFTISNATTNTFEYPIASAEGDATGTITAAGVASTDRGKLIKWVRGEDNFSDENVNTSTTDIRASVHGDVLHSSPVVINYNRYTDADGNVSNNDVYVFYGGGDGIFRAIKGGYATEAGAAVQIAPGREAWGFIPQEFFGQLNRLRTNAPTISSSFKKPYFADGPIGVYTKDANGNGRYGDVGDIVNLYITMRRGGRLIYALDVNDPHNPRFLWKIDSSTSGFSELGQTWSQPRLQESLAGLPFPVLIFGGGYDPAVEDIDPATITASDATSVTTAAGTVNRSMGRAIYVVNALTGALVWSAGGSNSNGAFTLTVPGMDFAIPSDLAIVANQSGGPTNRAYVGDMGGNMWRIDFRKDGSNGLTGTMVTKIAAVGAHTASGRRKFFFPPSVLSPEGQSFDQVLIGSGDREHPFDTTVTNRFYMFKDEGGDLGPQTGNVSTVPALSPVGTTAVITESALFDATTNCIQDCTGQAQANAVADLGTSSGWYITLGSGEKVVGNPVTAAGTTVFATNQPDAAAGGGTCGSNLGTARLYQINPADATATKDLNSSGGLTGSDRSEVLAGGGFVPRGDYRAIDLSTGPGGNGGGGPGKEKVVECVITGFRCTAPGGAALNARLRKFWFKEIDI
jgi:Tfp pilus tip-associated adhesin PilY1